MTGFPSYPDGEPIWTAAGSPEEVRDLSPSLALHDAVAALQRAAAGRRDLRVRLRDLVVTGGTVHVGGERLRLRERPVKQLHHRAARVLGRGVASGDDLRRGIALLGDRLVVLRVEDDVLRAVVGAHFSVMDDLDVLARIARAAAAMGWRDLRARFIATSEASTIVRATLARSRVDVLPGDAFEVGVEMANSEVGAGALALRSLTWRSKCWNYSLGPRSLRLPHVGGPHRLDRDLRKDLAHVVHEGRALLDAWRGSVAFDDANAVSSAAKDRRLACRLVEERRAQQVVEDATVPITRYGKGTFCVNAS